MFKHKAIIWCISWFFLYINVYTVFGSFAIKELRYKQENKWYLSIYLLHRTALGPGVYFASNRNDYQKHFLESEAMADAKGWQSHRHLWADSLDNVEFLTAHKSIGLQDMLRG
jgi:hypothetical protein